MLLLQTVSPASTLAHPPAVCVNQPTVTVYEVYKPCLTRPTITVAFEYKEPILLDTEVIVVKGPSEQVNTPAAPQPGKEADSNSNWIWIVLGILIGVVILGGAVYCVTKK